MFAFMPFGLLFSPFIDVWEPAPVVIEAPPAIVQHCGPGTDTGFIASFAPVAPATAPQTKIFLTPRPAVANFTAASAPRDLWRADDGLFYVDAEINGAAVRFLVDTGASMIVLTADDAKRVGAAPQPGDEQLVADTAAGKSSMAKVMLANMRVGETAAQGVPAAVAQEGLGISLLGQNWLSHLASVTIEGDRMTMR